MSYSAGSQAVDQFWICHRGPAELIRVPRELQLLDQGDSKGALRSPRFKHWMSNNDAFLPVGLISPTFSSHSLNCSFFFHFFFPKVLYHFSFLFPCDMVQSPYLLIQGGVVEPSLTSHFQRKLIKLHRFSPGCWPGWSVPRALSPGSLFPACCTLPQAGG